MKTNPKFFLSFLIFGLFVVNANYAQTDPEFKFSPAVSADGTLGSIQLDVDSPLSAKYVMDFFIMDWTEEGANSTSDYINKKSDLFTMEVDYVNKKVFLYLDTNSSETIDWSTKKWNSYFKSIR